MNNIPNFKVEVKDDDAKSYSIHFAALFSQNPNAIPILLLHGWPGKETLAIAPTDTCMVLR